MNNLSFALAVELTTYLGRELTIDGIVSGQSRWYYVNAQAGQWLYGAVYNAETGENWQLKLYDAEKALIRAAATGSCVKYIGLTAPRQGKYYFEVNAGFVKGRSSFCTFKAVLSGGSLDNLAANAAYDRLAAQDYLIKYWLSPNPAYPVFDADCANFVSQALHAGGMHMLGNANSRDSASSWFIRLTFKPDTAYYSATWTGADYFTKHWGTDCFGRGYRRAYDCRYYIGQDLCDNFGEIAGVLRPGDVIQLTRNQNTARYHTLMVFENTGADIKMSAHTYNTLDRSLFDEATNKPDMVFVLIRIKSGA